MSYVQTILAFTAMLSFSLMLIFSILRYVELKHFYQVSQRNHLKMLGSYYHSFDALNWDWRFALTILKTPSRIRQADPLQQEILVRLRRKDIVCWISFVFFVVSICVLAML